LFGHSEYFTDIWYILWPFGYLVANLVYFPPFWYIESRKNWLPRVRPTMGPKSSQLCHLDDFMSKSQKKFETSKKELEGRERKTKNI
jgi:hypothetical protein